LCSVDYASSYSTELQYHVRKASGAELRIVPESQRPTSGVYVFLGATQAARVAGLEGSGRYSECVCHPADRQLAVHPGRQSCRFRVSVETLQNFTGKVAIFLTGEKTGTRTGKNQPCGHVVGQGALHRDR